MKRYIISTEVPAGYLKTNRFNSKISDNNVLEAIEIAISQKFDQFDKFIDRQYYLTSGGGWTGIVDQYEEGYYIQLEATRANFNAFVSGDSVIRKPVHLSEKQATYNVSGDAGHVEYISSPTYYIDPMRADTLNKWTKKHSATTDQTYYLLNTPNGRATVISFYGDDPEEYGYEAKVFKDGQLYGTKFYYGEVADALAKSWAEDTLMGYTEEYN